MRSPKFNIIGYQKGYIDEQNITQQSNKQQEIKSQVNWEHSEAYYNTPKNGSELSLLI
jgi:hypothetical protein